MFHTNSLGLFSNKSVEHQNCTILTALRLFSFSPVSLKLYSFNAVKIYPRVKIVKFNRVKIHTRVKTVQFQCSFSAVSVKLD